MSRFVRAAIKDVPAYQEPHGDGVDLASNTNLFGRHPCLQSGDPDAAQYPEAGLPALRTVAAQHYGVTPEQIVVGNGSDQVIDLLLRATLEPGDKVAFHPPTFGMVELYATYNHGTTVPVPLTEQFQLDVDAMIAANAKVTFICNPNNPTGNQFLEADIKRIIDGVSGLVVLDEAYAEFAPTIDVDAPNVVRLRTLSKAHGLAGLRIGFGIGPADLMQEIDKVGGPYRVNGRSAQLAADALADDGFMQHTVEKVLHMRPTWQDALMERGFTVYPSATNFLLTKPPRDAKELAATLADEGFKVRTFADAPYIRVTVGPRDTLDAFLAALDAALGVNDAAV